VTPVGQEPDTDRLWTARSWPFVTSTLALMTFIAFESFAITTVLPVVMSDLHSPRWYSMAYAATLTTALLGTILGGNWADRHGTRPPLLAGGVLFLLGIALCALAPSTAVFVLGRLLQGFGGGIDSVVLYVLIARNIPAGPRPRMFGLLTAAWLLPSMLGPLLAGTLTELTGWRAVFGLILVGAAASLLGLLVCARDTGARVPSSAASPALFGRRGMLAIVAAGALMLLHLGGQSLSQQSLVLVPSGLVLLLWSASRLLPRGTLLLRGTAPRLVALRAVLGATVTATDVYLTLYLQHQRDFAPTAAGLVIAIGAAGWAAGAWIQGRFGDTAANHRGLVAASGPLVLCGPAGVLLHVLGAAPIGLVLGACVAMGAGMGIAYPRVSSRTLAIADPSEHGKYSSALQAGESMAATGLLAATAILLLVFPGAEGFVASYGLLVGLGLVAVLIAWAPPTRSREGSRVPAADAPDGGSGSPNV
jgi:MFS family permease